MPCNRKKCKNPVNTGSDYCEKHKARIGAHRKVFVEAVKQRVRFENNSKLICENAICLLRGKIEYMDHWFDVDHIIEVNEFDNNATVKIINAPINGLLLCKLCHADKNFSKRG